MWCVSGIVGAYSIVITAWLLACLGQLPLQFTRFAIPHDKLKRNRDGARWKGFPVPLWMIVVTGPVPLLLFAAEILEKQDIIDSLVFSFLGQLFGSALILLSPKTFTPRQAL